MVGLYFACEAVVKAAAAVVTSKPLCTHTEMATHMGAPPGATANGNMKPTLLMVYYFQTSSFVLDLWGC